MAKRTERKHKNHSSILITRKYGNIGDILMMTPGIREFSEASDLPVDIVIPKKFEGTLDNLPYLRECHHFEDDVHLRDIIKKAERNSARFVDLSNYEFNYEKSHQPKISKTKIQLFCEKLGVPYKDTHLDIVLTPDEKRTNEEYLKSLQIDKNGLILIGSGSVTQTRAWPLEHWKELSRKIKKIGYHVVIVDKNMNWDQPGLIFFNGKNIREYFALCSTARLLISNDSSMLHIGSGAFDRDAIAIFGPTDPEMRCVYPTSKFVKVDMECGPCWYERCVDYKRMNDVPPCMRNVTVDMVYRKAVEVLKHA
jgi:ADP-heptose:LPS heptosyltransferase